MRNAYECKEEFSAGGKCIRRERSIGPIVPWMIVALVALLTRQAIVSLSPSFWDFFKH
jgi:hypothetical protein